MKAEATGASARDHARHVLVGHGGEDDRQRPAAGVLQIRRQRGGAGRVVRGVDQQLAAALRARSPVASRPDRSLDSGTAAIRAAPATRIGSGP